MLTKRAVSPLIATVLLVMIVVSIGAAVMVVIQGLSEEQIENIGVQQDILKCGTDVDVSVLDVGRGKRICYDSDIVAVALENRGQSDIESFNLVVVGDTIARMEGTGAKLIRFNVTTMQFSFDNTTNIAKISLNPRITGSSSTEEIPCEAPGLIFDQDEIEDMDNCSSSSVTWDDSITQEFS